MPAMNLKANVASLHTPQAGVCDGDSPAVAAADLPVCRRMGGRGRSASAPGSASLVHQAIDKITENEQRRQYRRDQQQHPAPEQIPPESRLLPHFLPELLLRLLVRP